MANFRSMLVLTLVLVLTSTLLAASSSASYTRSEGLHRKDARWMNAASFLRGRGREEEHHLPQSAGLEWRQKKRGRLVLVSEDVDVAWGGDWVQLVVSNSSATILNHLLEPQPQSETHSEGAGEEELGVITDFLAPGTYVVAVAGAFVPTFKERVEGSGGVVTEYSSRQKLAPELVALLEVLKLVTSGGNESSSSSFEVELGGAGTLQVLTREGAMEIKFKNQENETLDFFSPSVDRSGRLELFVSVPGVLASAAGAAGRKGIAQALASSCPSCVIEEARDAFEAAFEARQITNSSSRSSRSSSNDNNKRKHVSFKIAVPVDEASEMVASLASLPFVNWIENEVEVRIFNHIASEVLQIGSKGRKSRYEPNTSISKRPFWEMGLDGTGELVGVGDTGLDVKSCFFWDPDHSVGYDHAKVLGYRGFADYEDTSGHGTHVCGSIAGRAGNGSGYEEYNGMAPGAKLAFTDLGLSYGDQRGLIAPQTMEEYYEYAYGLGARVHSDSWGGLSTAYTRSAREVDEYHFYHPEFLALIAAGNDGEFLSSEGVESTVSTPATCKNALAVGATLSMGYIDPPEDPVTNFEIMEPVEYKKRPFQLVSSLFTPVFEFKANETVDLVMTEFPRVCEELSAKDRDAVKGKVVLVERGDCFFIEKVQKLKDAGSIGTIIYNNEESGSGFFKMASSEGGFFIDMPASSVPMSTGRLLAEAIKSSNSSVAKIRFVSRSDESLPAFESIAEYSSFGPTMDGRVKPDVVAPGEEIKSATSVDSDNQCATDRISGTSMATPLVAGITAIVRQYLVGGYYPLGERGMTKPTDTPPSGALIKGVIINGAAELKGFAQSGLPLEPAPSFRQGWGRVELDTSLPMPGSGRALKFADWKNLQSTGDEHVYCLTTPQTNLSSISVTLNWMDAPGALSGGGYLVNDLDLDIDVPEGSADVSWGASVHPDRKNNVEKAVILEPAGGEQYAIKVKAHQIQWPMGNGRGQLYALVVFGPEGIELNEGCEKLGSVIEEDLVVEDDEMVQVFDNQEGSSAMEASIAGNEE